MKQEVLQACTLFSDIGEDELASILNCLDARTKHYAKGDFIYKAGQTTKDVGLVLEGCAHIIQEDYWGNRTLVDQVNPGEVFGEAFACAEEALLSLSVQAMKKDTTILFLDYRRIVSACSSACIFHTRLIKNMVSLMAHKNISLTQKVEHITQRSIRDKILSFFSSQAMKKDAKNFEMSFSRQELADYLAVDRASLSRSLGMLQDEGLISLQGRKVTLL